MKFSKFHLSESGKIRFRQFGIKPFTKFGRMCFE